MLRDLFASFRQESSDNGGTPVPADPAPPSPIAPEQPHRAGEGRVECRDDDWLIEVKEGLDRLQGSLDSFREEARTSAGKADRSRDIIDRLEAENRGLKCRESERRQEPLIKGVISLFDDLRSVTRHAQSRARGDEPVPELLRSVLVFERQVLEILRRSDVEAFEPAIAAPFDGVRQEAWETVDTVSRDQEMRIAEVIRLGFEFSGRVIRPAAVKVYRVRAAATAER